VLAQSAEQWGGANQVTDVIATDDEDVHGRIQLMQLIIWLIRAL
jgi:hypothetical protein